MTGSKQWASENYMLGAVDSASGGGAGAVVS